MLYGVGASLLVGREDDLTGLLLLGILVTLTDDLSVKVEEEVAPVALFGGVDGQADSLVIGTLVRSSDVDDSI